MEEKRYAFLVGINDYELSPLSACVNDSRDVKKVLINNCNFEEENIFMFTSDDTNKNSDIYGNLTESIEKLKKKFNPEKDSIFFQFAGHGFCEDDESKLCFHNSNITIAQIYRMINSLSPRFQFYLIDSCQSGGRTLTRGKTINEDDYIRRLIENSGGTLFLYACKDDEFAEEIDGNGILTKYFISAIKNDNNYDEKGILSTGNLSNYIKRDMMAERQNPVCESRDTGYYPLATRKWVKEKVDRKTKITPTKNTAYLNFSPTSILKELLNKGLDSLEIKNTTDGRLNSSDNELLKKIYNKLQIKPLEEGMKQIRQEKPYDDYDIFKPMTVAHYSISTLMKELKKEKDNYTCSLGEEARYRVVQYKSLEKFKNSMRIGYLMLPSKFGIIIVYFSEITGFRETVPWNNILVDNFDDFSREEILEKEEKLTKHFKEKFSILFKQLTLKDEALLKIIEKEFEEYQKVTVKL